MSELTRDLALEFLADYITNNEINYVGGEFEREDSKEKFLVVVSKESALKNLTEENQRLTVIATKHATRADELYEALECICSYLSEDGLIATGLAKEIVNAQTLLRKRTVSNSNDD